MCPENPESGDEPLCDKVGDGGEYFIMNHELFNSPGIHAGEQFILYIIGGLNPRLRNAYYAIHAMNGVVIE
jgi:hypothetical protein